MTEHLAFCRKTPKSPFAATGTNHHKSTQVQPQQNKPLPAGLAKPFLFAQKCSACNILAPSANSVRRSQSPPKPGSDPCPDSEIPSAEGPANPLCVELPTKRAQYVYAKSRNSFLVLSGQSRRIEKHAKAKCVNARQMYALRTPNIQPNTFAMCKIRAITHPSPRFLGSLGGRFTVSSPRNERKTRSFRQSQPPSTTQTGHILETLRK